MNMNLYNQMTVTELIGILERAKEKYGDLPIFGKKRHNFSGNIFFYEKGSNIYSVGMPEKWLELHL